MPIPAEESSDFAFLYARFSPRPKLKKSGRIEDGMTLDQQLDICRSYARMRGIVIVEEVTDPFESARKIPLFRRPGGQRLAELPVFVKHIITPKIDRLFRCSEDGLRLMQHWRKRGIAVHFVDQGGNSLNMHTAVGRWMVRSLLSMSEFEADLISERTKATMLFRQANGQRMTRKDQLPLGWMLDPDDPTEKSTVVCQAEWELLELLESLHNAGLSTGQVAKNLNEKNTFIRGRPWTSNSVAKALKRHATNKEYAQKRQQQ